MCLRRCLCAYTKNKCEFYRHIHINTSTATENRLKSAHCVNQKNHSIFATRVANGMCLTMHLCLCILAFDSIVHNRSLSSSSLATGLLCGAIMSDYWEEIGWDKKDLIRANVSLTWYLDGQVAMLESSVNQRVHRVAKSSSFLVPMHGGIWIMCVSLSGTNYCVTKRKFALDNDKLRQEYVRAFSHTHTHSSLYHHIYIRTQHTGISFSSQRLVSSLFSLFYVLFIFFLINDCHVGIYIILLLL